MIKPDANQGIWLWWQMTYKQIFFKEINIMFISIEDEFDETHNHYNNNNNIPGCNWLSEYQ